MAANVRILRYGALRVFLHDAAALETALSVLDSPGETLKQSHKSVTRLVVPWVVKESGSDGVAGLFKHTFLRRRYRRAWEAAHHLARRGVPVPMPLAYVEETYLGVVTRSVFVCEYLEGLETVEQYAARALRGAPCEIAIRFFTRLAQAVNHLCSCGAYHSDLSGKNILTEEGESFHFVDLDGVALGRTYTDRLRLKNHVQLYDSFCDLFDEGAMAAFIAAMLPRSVSQAPWLAAVKEGQRKRRARANAAHKPESR